MYTSYVFHFSSHIHICIESLSIHGNKSSNNKRNAGTNEDTKWSMNNRTIDIVSQFSFLGVLLDEHLSWKEHVNMVTNKLSKIPGVLKRLKYVFLNKY